MLLASRRYEKKKINNNNKPPFNLQKSIYMFCYNCEEFCVLPYNL